MNIQVFAEQRNNAFKKASFETISAARALAPQLGGKVFALVVGYGVGAIAKELGTYGADRILVFDNPQLENHSNTAYAEVIAQVAASEGTPLIFLAATQMGKDIAPRVAVKLNAGLASDCIALHVEQG